MVGHSSTVTLGILALGRANWGPDRTGRGTSDVVLTASSRGRRFLVLDPYWTWGLLPGSAGDDLLSGAAGYRTASCSPFPDTAGRPELIGVAGWYGGGPWLWWGRHDDLLEGRPTPTGCSVSHPSF